MAISIIDKYVDIAGYWRVTITNGTKQASFKFNHDPTNQELQDALYKYIAVLQAAKDNRDAEEVDRNDILYYVYLFNEDQNNLTNTQKLNLLTRLCSRIVARGFK